MADPLREGSRWRYAKPSSDEVAAWFKDVPLDEGMEHEKFISGVVLIPAKEKVKKTRDDMRGTMDVEELTFTPYVRVDTRIAYFRTLAEKLDMVAVIEPVDVPRIEGDSAARNTNLPKGFWWYLAPAGQSHVRYLCCTMRVALYRKEDWYDELLEERPLRPAREGIATKQVATNFGSGNTDPNALAKAETGAIGRALGMAGILVVGTGIATAEDMAELGSAAPPPPELPETGAETPEELNAALLGLQASLQQAGAWPEIAAWWKERSEAEGWSTISDAPIEVRRGMKARMERALEEARANSSPGDASSS